MYKKLSKISIIAATPTLYGSSGITRLNKLVHWSPCIDPSRCIMNMKPIPTALLQNSEDSSLRKKPTVAKLPWIMEKGKYDKNQIKPATAPAVFAEKGKTSKYQFASLIKKHFI